MSLLHICSSCCRAKCRVDAESPDCSLLMTLKVEAERAAHADHDEWAVPAASLEGYRKIAGGPQRATLLETEQAWLAAVKPDLVVSDIVPLACAAAAAVGIPCVCISNFSWGEGKYMERISTELVCLQQRRLSCACGRGAFSYSRMRDGNTYKSKRPYGRGRRTLTCCRAPVVWGDAKYMFDGDASRTGDDLVWWLLAPSMEALRSTRRR